MTYCSNCGEVLPENAYFCSRCGMRTREGSEAGVSTQWEDLSVTFSKMGTEFEKAFTKLGKEMEKVFKIARDKMKDATSREPIVCPHCKEKNSFRASFCFACGQKLKPMKV